MVAQTARRSDDDMRALGEVPPLLGRIHAPDAGRDPRARLAVEPNELAADLERKLTRRRDDERQRLANEGQRTVGLEQLRRHGEAERDRLAGPGLGRNDEVPPVRLRFEHGGLNRRRRGIAAGGERFGEKRRQ